MASWLKVAEGLLEVVDRRAKQVATELSEEQSDSQSSASNGQESQAGRTKSKEKDHWRPYTARSPPVNDAEQEQTIIHASPSNAITANDTDHSSEISVAMPSNLTTQADTESESDANKATRNSSIPLADPAVNDISKLDVDVKVEMSATENNIEVGNPLLNGENDVENTSSGHERSSSAPLDATGVHSMHQHHPPPEELDSKVESVDENALRTTNIEKSDNEIVGSHGNNNIQEKELEILQESLPKKQQEQKSDTPPKKVQDQLDEAQGLLTSTVSTGQSKEARLARVCAGLSSRLQEYKSENAQLEELLVAERERCNTYEVRIKQLQQELSTSKSGLGKVESSMADALAAKNSEIESLRTSMDELKKQAAISEGQLASLQANMETVMRSRELTETRMMQALREEVASVERRAEEEHAAHSATKMSAMEREVELEHRAVEASTALARIQRTADERASRAAELEQKLALLEAECASLNQELQEMEARVRRSEKRSPEEANQALKIQAWQEEVERARQGLRDAESKFSTMEAELQKMRVEMAGMKRDAEHYSRQEHMELEKRYRELTDLLYYKQTQLEAMASEKAAAEFQLEKEANRLQEAQIEAERSRVARRPSSSWEEDSDFKALEPLPMHHRHMVGASIQLQKAVKLIDSGAVSATRFLWRYPIARVILLFYLVFVHLFLMFLLHRLQEQADNFAAKEVAASMGLGTSNLP